MSSRQISYSVSLAEGKPISISLTPISSRVWKYSSLFLKIHGVHQSLVSVPQVYRAPDRSFGDDMVRPGAPLDFLGLEGNVLCVSGIHNACSPFLIPPRWGRIVPRGRKSKTPPTFSSQGRYTNAVPPWFSRRSPERPSKPPTRPRLITKPTVPPYCCSGGLLRDQLYTEGPAHRFAPTTGSLKRDTRRLFSRRRISYGRF